VQQLAPDGVLQAVGDEAGQLPTTSTSGTR
jgi:hypothetical protein